MPKKIPMYGSDKTPLCNLLYWYEEVYASGCKCLQAHAIHDTAVAGKEYANMELKAAIIIENLAVIWVRVADKCHQMACLTYGDMTGYIFMDDLAVKDLATISSLNKEHRVKKVPQTKSDPKGKGKECAMNVTECWWWRWYWGAWWGV
jgi:hypothetical protein